MVDINSRVNEILNDEIRSFLSNYVSLPYIQKCIEAVLSVAGYDLDEKYKYAFSEFHSYISAPQPDFISKLRSDPKQGHWYNLLVNGVLCNVRSSFSCVRYHEDRLKSVEKELISTLIENGAIEHAGNGSWGLGGTSILDFEYQAYVLAYRRCLDQFAGAIAAFFKNKYSSFRTLPAFLDRRKPQEVARAISEIHKKHVQNFEFVLSEGGIVSVRDRIAHYEFVPAGTVNISARGIVLVGGGENLNMSGMDNILLTDCLAKKTEALYQCIEEVILTFITSVAAWEEGKSGTSPQVYF